MILAQTVPNATTIVDSFSQAVREFGIFAVVILFLLVLLLVTIIYNNRNSGKDSELLSAVIQQLGKTTADFATLTREEHTLREAENQTRAKWTDGILVSVKELAESAKEYPARMIADVLTGVRTIADDNLKAYTKTQVNVAEELGTMSETNGKLSAAIEELKTQIEQLKNEIKGTVIIGHNQATKLTDTLNAVLLALTEISSKIDTQTMKAAAVNTTPPSTTTPLIETKETKSE
jgi:hypothetical protein